MPNILKKNDFMTPEQYFEQFRKNTIGYNCCYTSPYGRQKMIYADWVASGRLYRPLEDIFIDRIGPFVGNTHTETSENGKLMTEAYHLAHKKIKDHVNAGPNDVIITTGFGMTGAIVKFQRILGMKHCGDPTHQHHLHETEMPVVFLTHMEHHSNQTSWYETNAEVVIIEPGDDLLIDLSHLENALKKYKSRQNKIGSFTACSNVTGIRTPIHQMARLMHEYGGHAFVDYAASAPYDDINMHPGDPLEKLDAIYFSPHKFLGGPGASGVLIFDSCLYKLKVPDQPGGGTVEWTNRWGEYKFIDDIEVREDGGTPGFLQAIRTALAIELKACMTVEKIHQREDELVDIAFRELSKIPGLHILADKVRNRLGVISFYLEDIHYNMVVKLLSDRFGVQVRGGCACAGTYGHYLLHVSHEESKSITDKIDEGDLSEKPGWVRLSLHPTMKDSELLFIADAIRQIQENHAEWSGSYTYNKHNNEFRYKDETPDKKTTGSWFSFD
ncbi:MAG: aminotransferase class V-fold PLP-dependent enzyme [Bacteroidota bacterium]